MLPAPTRISQGQTVEWTWPWKIKAPHMRWVALLAPWVLHQTSEMSCRQGRSERAPDTPSDASSTRTTVYGTNKETHLSFLTQGDGRDLRPHGRTQPAAPPLPRGQEVRPAPSPNPNHRLLSRHQHPSYKYPPYKCSGTCWQPPHSTNRSVI